MRCSTCDAPLHFPSETKTGSCYDCQSRASVHHVDNGPVLEPWHRSVVIDIILGAAIVGWVATRFLA